MDFYNFENLILFHSKFKRKIKTLNLNRDCTTIFLSSIPVQTTSTDAAIADISYFMYKIQNIR